MINDKETTNLLLIRGFLRRSNYTVLPDFVGNNKDEWVHYRKALRDLPKDPNWPDVIFPDTPSDPPLKTENIDNGDS